MDKAKKNSEPEQHIYQKKLNKKVHLTYSFEGPDVDLIDWHGLLVPVDDDNYRIISGHINIYITEETK